MSRPRFHLSLRQRWLAACTAFSRTSGTPLMAVAISLSLPMLTLSRSMVVAQDSAGAPSTTATSQPRATDRAKSQPGKTQSSAQSSARSSGFASGSASGGGFASGGASGGAGGGGNGLGAPGFGGSGFNGTPNGRFFGGQNSGGQAGGISRGGGGAFASGGGSASASASVGGPRNTNGKSTPSVTSPSEAGVSPNRREHRSSSKSSSVSSSSKDSKRVTTAEKDQQKVTITETPSKITVRWDDLNAKGAKPRVVSAPNLATLQAKHPDAFAAYQEHVAGQGRAAGGGDLGIPPADGDNPAARLLAEELKKLRDSAESPEQRRLLDEALKELPR